jgi:hypothetical protein
MVEDPTSSLMQGPEWTDALCSFTSWRDASRLYQTTDGRSFVLPLVEKGFGKGGRFLSSMPSGWGMGGIVGSHPIRPEDISAVISDLKGLRCLGFRVLSNPLRGSVWEAGLGNATVSLPRYSHILDLDGGFEYVQRERYSRSGHRTLKKAHNANLDIERDTTGRLIPLYREMFERSIVRWAERDHEPLRLARMRARREDPAGKLEFLAETLGEDLVTWVARHDGRPVAASIILRGNSTFAWRGAMDEDLASVTNGSSLIQHLAIEESCSAGERYYYMGESGESAGIALFKERFGAVGYPYPEIRFERLPITRWNESARTAVKRLVGYRSN